MSIERDIILDLPGLLKQAGHTRTHTTTRGDTSYDILALIERLKDREARKISLPKINRSRNTGFQKKRYADADTKFPVIVDEAGTLWDGRHRVAKLQDEGEEEVQAVTALPEDIEAVKQALDRDIILDLPGLLKRAAALQGGVFTPRGNPTMRSFTANTPAEGFFGEYESVGEWANELPNTALTRPSEGSFWKGDVGSTLKSWAGRGMKRKGEERDHATQFRNIQAAIAHREGVDSRNRAWGAAAQNQPTAAVDSPWGEQTSGPVGQPNFNAGYNPQGGPGASWDQGMGGVFYDVMRRNPHEFELHSSTGNESTWLHKPSGMQYSVPDAPSSSNRFAVHAEQPNMDEWANAMRWRQGKPARTT
jgi:hypothetical protein